MVAQIIVPKLGVSTEPLQLVEWKVKEGDWVETGSVVLTIETEKIQLEVESEASGFLHIIIDADNKATIGSVAGMIAETKDEFSEIQKKITKQEVLATEAEVPAIKTGESTKDEKTEAPPTVASKGERIRISPIARKMAEENGLDISKLVGTGPNGRIVREDIERETEAGRAGEAVPSGATSEETVAMLKVKKVKASVPLSGMRKAIAEHMHRSLSVSAQLTVMGEIDMTEMVKLRENFLREEEALGTRISYTDLMVFVTARVLKEFPIVNSSLVGDEIKLWDDINIGVAVALDEGLIVPVVRNADQKSLVEISQEVKSLAEKARARKLTSDEAHGGTFTITNLGALGGGYRFETVIVNQPESAILGIGGITDRVVARDGQIVISPIMTYYLTYDHRVIDGAVAARFIQSLVRMLENPSLLIV